MSRVQSEKSPHLSADSTGMRFKPTHRQAPWRRGDRERVWRFRLCLRLSRSPLLLPQEEPSKDENELPRSKLTGYQTNRESLTRLSPPHVSSGGLVLTSPGFPLKACGNDGLW